MRHLILSTAFAAAGFTTACSGFHAGPAIPLEQQDRFSAAAPVISEFSKGIFKDHAPFYIVLGPDANMWFTQDIDPDFGLSYVSRITPLGTVTNFGYTNQLMTFPSFNGITVGSDKNLWITDTGDGFVNRITLQGKVTSFRLPGPAWPQGITNGPDGALWFTDLQQNTVDRMTTNGRLNLYRNGISTQAGLLDIATGPDGNLWFTETWKNAIGRISTGGRVAEFSTGISPHANLNSIAAGKDGNLWFTETNAVGRITTSGLVTEFRKGITTGQHPVWIAPGPDGAMWFTEKGTSARIARITFSGAITEYSSGITARELGAIARGAGRTMWFTELRPAGVARANL